MPIFNTCGAPPYTLTIFFQDNFSSLRASTSVSPTLPICNPISMWALQCTALSTESTVAPESTSNSRTRDWFKLNWHFAIGRIMTTCIFGLQSQSIRTEQTIAALKWLSFRRRQFFHPKKGIQTQIYSTTRSPNLDFITVSKPFRTLDHHTRLRFKYQGKV